MLMDDAYAVVGSFEAELRLCATHLVSILKAECKTYGDLDKKIKQLEKQLRYDGKTNLILIEEMRTLVEDEKSRLLVADGSQTIIDNEPKDSPQRTVVDVSGTQVCSADFTFQQMQVQQHRLDTHRLFLMVSIALSMLAAAVSAIALIAAVI